MLAIKPSALKRATLARVHPWVVFRLGDRNVQATFTTEDAELRAHTTDRNSRSALAINCRWPARSFVKTIFEPYGRWAAALSSSDARVRRRTREPATSMTKTSELAFCHAEGRGFESLHPLPEAPRKRGVRVCTGLDALPGLGSLALSGNPMQVVDERAQTSSTVVRVRT